MSMLSTVFESCPRRRLRSFSSHIGHDRAAEPVDVAARAKELFRRDNLVAWCIVPFDAKKRGPEERAAMLEKLGLQALCL